MRVRALVLALIVLAACANDIVSLGGVRQIDTWQQAPTDEVDILFVVDNSNSMELEQNLLAAGFDAFISRVDEANIDFHLGVITTAFLYDDPDRGVLRGDPRILTRDSTRIDANTGELLDYVGLFRERALVGLRGSGREKGLEAASFALSTTMTSTGGPNEGFLRPSANLLVVFVSDEDDCSDEGRLGAEADNLDCYRKSELLTPVSTFVRRFEALKGNERVVQVAAIVGLQDARSVCAQTTQPGLRYIELAEALNGLSNSICESEAVWRDFLFTLGLNASGILTVFELSSGVKDGTLEVYVDDVLQVEDPENGFTFDPETRTITFHGDGVPPRGSQIRAEYEAAIGT
ncbi:MAG: hypothetical protein H6732_00840 [Alphaproteobacteria bacterium]|nr:hypothetical protein [Alphaproteobacteria bacterium]